MAIPAEAASRPTPAFEDPPAARRGPPARGSGGPSNEPPLVTPSPVRPPDPRPPPAARMMAPDASLDRDPPPARFVGRDRLPPPAARFTKPVAAATDSQPAPLEPGPVPPTRAFPSGPGRAPKYPSQAASEANEVDDGNSDNNSNLNNSGPPLISPASPRLPPAISPNIRPFKPSNDSNDEDDNSHITPPPCKPPSVGRPLPNIGRPLPTRPLTAQPDSEEENTANGRPLPTRILPQRPDAEEEAPIAARPPLAFKPPARLALPPNLTSSKSHSEDDGDESPVAVAIIPAARPPPKRIPKSSSRPATDDESEDPTPSPSVSNGPSPSISPSVSSGPPPRQKGPSPSLPALSPRPNFEESSDTNSLSPTPAIAIGRPPPRRAQDSPLPRMAGLPPARSTPTQDDESPVYRSPKPAESKPISALPPFSLPNPARGPVPKKNEEPSDGYSASGMKHIPIVDNACTKSQASHSGILKKDGRLGSDTYFVQIVGRQFQYFDSEADAIANKKGKVIDLDLIANLDSQVDSLAFTLEVPSSNRNESTTTWLALDVVDRMKWVSALVAARVPMKEVAASTYTAPKATAEITGESTARILELFGDPVKKKSRKAGGLYWHQRWLIVEDKKERFAYFNSEDDAKYALNGQYIKYADIVLVTVPEKGKDQKQRFNFTLMNGKSMEWQASTPATGAGWMYLFAKRGLKIAGQS